MHSFISCRCCVFTIYSTYSDNIIISIFAKNVRLIKHVNSSAGNIIVSHTARLEVQGDAADSGDGRTAGRGFSGANRNQLSVQWNEVYGEYKTLELHYFRDRLNNFCENLY